MLHTRDLANRPRREGRQGSGAGREPELQMREGTSPCRQGSRQSRLREEEGPSTLPLDGRYTLTPLWSLCTGGAWPLLPETNRAHGPDPLVSLPCKPALSPLPPHHLVHCSKLLGLTAGYRGEPIRNREQKFWGAGHRKHPLSAEYLIKSTTA